MLDNAHIQRLLGNQQIISREIINGEHHIITRNENGETILTRIVNAPATTAPDPTPTTQDQLISKLSTGGDPTNNGLYHQNPPTPTTTADGLPTTVLQYEKDINQQQQNHQQQPKQLVYSVGGGEPKNVIYGDPKASIPQQQHFEPTLSQQQQDPSEPKPQIDYVYNDGNKTVIYTDQKGLESLYANAAGGDLGLMEGTQIVVHGNVQYTQQQQPDGTMVYVVASTGGAGGAGSGTVGELSQEDIEQIQQR